MSDLYLNDKAFKHINKQGRRQGFRPGCANILFDKIVRLPTLVFSLPAPRPPYPP